MRKRQSNYIICFILTFLLLSMNLQVFANTVTVNSSIDNEDITSKFKDKDFKKYVYTLIGKSSSEPILYSDVKNIKRLSMRIDIYGCIGGLEGFVSFDSLSGIEYFTSLTDLSCSSHNLKTLNLSNNTRLTNLDCSGNKLKTLDLSKNTALTTLDCSSNDLTTLNISNNTNLTTLHCSDNNLTSLDLSSYTTLTELICAHNNLTTLDVSKHTGLTTLDCNSNYLPLLNVSNNTSLTTLDCSSNYITSLDISKNTNLTTLKCHNNNLPTLDASNSTALTHLYCDSNKLTTLDVSKNTKLYYLNCSNNLLPTLDLSNNTTLPYLDCSNNQLATLDLSNNTALSNLRCNNNQLTTLDLSKNIKLSDLYCNNNQLTTLDLSKNIILNRLNCFSNKLPTLDLSKNTSLHYLRCYSNQLTTLDLSTNTNLRELKCYGNKLTSLDLSKNTELIDLLSDENAKENKEIEVGKSGTTSVSDISDDTDITSKFTDKYFKIYVYALIGKTSPEPILYSDVKNITSLTIINRDINSLNGIEYFTALTELVCSGNPLTTLDLSKNTALTNLDCESNNLTSLNLSNDTALTVLNCSCNKLTALDVSTNTELTALICWSNNLTTLDVSKNTKLKDLNCKYNQLTTLYSIKDTWDSTSYRPQYIVSTSDTTTDSLVITIGTAKTAVLATPKINYLGVDHSPLVVGDTEKFTVTSKYDGLVQYRAFLFDGKTWDELTSGYGEPVDAKTPYVLPETSPFKLGKYKLSVWVKRAGEIGSNSNKNYDTYYIADLNCVTRDNANRVYANGGAKIETKGLTVKVNGIENIDGIKGPYLYRLFVFNPTSGIWSNGAKEYSESPSYTFDEPGTYMVIIHANTAKSTTWKNYLAGKTKGAYEAWKTVVVTVKNEEMIKVIDTTVKTAQFGVTVNVTLTAEGVKNFATATKYQIFDGAKAISTTTELGKATTVFPAKASGDKVSIKLLDASAKEIKEIEVLLGESGTL